MKPRRKTEENVERCEVGDSLDDYTLVAPFRKVKR